jgi:2-oxoisovalerate dehydrogenase E1 component alpha subunit
MRFSKISKAFKDVPSEYIYSIKQFRVIDLEGNLIAKEYNNISKETLNKIFELMIAV